MRVFITEMLRWGEDETHHYIIGAYTTVTQAKFAGECHKTWRGGKYQYRVVEVKLDEPVAEDVWQYHMQCFPDPNKKPL